MGTKDLNTIIAIILIMIIERSEVAGIKSIKKWLLIFGRRKTGKTFLVKNFLEYDEYFFVKRDRSIVSEKDEAEITYETFINLLKRSISENKTVVIDEFHRLGEDFLDFLHYSEKKGKVILISSTLYLSKKLFTSRSAILGLFAEVPISLISLRDVLKKLREYPLDKKTMVEVATLLREPLAIKYFDEKDNSRELISKVLLHSIRTVPALIGEIFTEEERSISAIYEGILRAVANGKNVSGEISSYLFSRKLIKKDDPSIIQQYLNNLVGFGIIKKIKKYNMNKFVYKHVSSLAMLYYYADEKYNFSEREISAKEVREIVDEVLPKIVEDYIREFLAKRYGLRENIFESNDFDVDVCLTKFKKIDTIAEIKWKNKISDKEIEKTINNFEKIKAKRKLLIVPDKSKIKTDKIEVVDLFDFI